MEANYDVEKVAKLVQELDHELTKFWEFYTTLAAAFDVSRQRLRELDDSEHLMALDVYDSLGSMLRQSGEGMPGEIRSIASLIEDQRWIAGDEPI